MTDAVAFVIRSLQVADLRAIRAFPSQTLPVLSEPLVAVGVCSIDAQTLPDACYLQWTCSLDVYSDYRNGALACEEAALRCVNALRKGITDFCVTQIQYGELYYHAASDCFRIRILVTMDCYEEDE